MDVKSSAAGHADLKAETDRRSYEGSETVLLVDDHGDLLKLLESVLTECGYRVITAYDGQNAIDLFKTHADAIDIILMDIIMPNKDGVRAYNEIRSIRPEIKVIFMSGFPSASFGELHGRIDLIIKPFLPFELVRKIREKLDAPDPGSID